MSVQRANGVIRVAAILTVVLVIGQFVCMRAIAGDYYLRPNTVGSSTSGMQTHAIVVAKSDGDKEKEKGGDKCDNKAKNDKQKKECEAKAKEAKRKQDEQAKNHADDQRKKAQSAKDNDDKLKKEREAKAREEAKRKQEQQPSGTVNIRYGEAKEDLKAKIQCVDFVRESRTDLAGVHLGNAQSKYEQKAKNFLEAAQDKGFKTGQVPREGAVVVFDSTTKNKYGHVAIVTKVHEDGSFDVQEANWVNVDLERGGSITVGRNVSATSKNIRGFVYDK